MPLVSEQIQQTICTNVLTVSCLKESKAKKYCHSVTGESFRSISFQYRMGERTVSNIVIETCKALFAAMHQQFLKVGTTKNLFYNKNQYIVDKILYKRKNITNAN